MSDMNQITALSPIDQSPVTSRDATSIKDVPELLSRSVSAFKDWSNGYTLSERLEILHKFIEELGKNEAEIAKDLTAEMGRPIRYTPFEVKTTMARAKYMCSIAERELSIVDVEDPSIAQPGIKRYIKRVPVGPILVITAWNFPYLITINSIVPALLAGNSILLKPSPQTMKTAEHLLNALKLAGLPNGVFQIVYTGDNEFLRNLVQKEEIQLVCFTGSVAGGRAIAEAASSRFINVGLELGGKDPAYVRADADVKYCASQVLDGAMFNSGQSCCSVERVYIHESIYDEFLKLMVEEAKTYKLGDPFDPETTLGPVISLKSADTIRSQIKDAEAQGAKLHINTTEFIKDDGKNTFVTPQILTNVDHSMRVMSEETFGPVVGIQMVKSDNEAIKLMNDSIYGLTASVWTTNYEEGQNICDKLEAGTVFINRCDYPDPALAWTGVKESGRGITLSKFGFDQFVRAKSYHVKMLL